MDQQTPQPGKPLWVAVPSAAPGGLEAKVAQHFGRCTCFTIARMDNGLPEQAATVEKAAQSGCHAAVSLLKAHGVTVLLCKHLGWQPLNACRENGILILESSQATVREALAAFAASVLHPLNDQAVCAQRGAHGGQRQSSQQHGRERCRSTDS